ncbi:MAG: hypothetical protein QOG85_507 [Gaiellaceae bacterium]|jgi:hypothetical protein|nr:hypothetical protein [Gaiellaceae bacterium]
MDGGYIRFELADGELIELSDDDIACVYRELWSRKSEEGAGTTATLLSHEVQLPEEERRTIALTQVEGEALWDAMTAQRVTAHRY